MTVKNHDLVSVIIVNFNSDNLLTQCVNSVLKSTISANIYIIDNASDDNSLQQLRQAISYHKRVQIIKNKTNLGFARAANIVLPKITSQYLLFLNPDCFIFPNTLAKFIAIMDDYPNVGMAGALVRNIDGTEQAGCRRTVPTPWRSIVRILYLDKLFPHSKLFKNFVLTTEPLPTEPMELEGISGACMFVRHSALKVVGAMDEDYFLHCEDLDWFMRFRQHQFKILFVPTIEVTHVKGGCSHHQPFRVLWYKHRGMIKFYRKFYRQKYPWILFMPIILAVWMRFTLLTIGTFFKKWLTW
ncbi:MAG: glycosyltransferase family 2 protein [Thiomargarita sp.]|nr:glycosyltransferase family 2 protein [Thiomargarita sp.]